MVNYGKSIKEKFVNLIKSLTGIDLGSKKGGGYVDIMEGGGMLQKAAFFKKIPKLFTLKINFYD